MHICIMMMNLGFQKFHKYYEEENFNENVRTREITKLTEITELNVITVPRKLVYV